MTAKKAKTSPKSEGKSFKIKKLTDKQRLILGCSLLLVALAVLVSMVSFFFSWKVDQSELGHFAREIENDNLLQKFGAHVGDLLVYKGFGIMSFIFPILISLTGLSYLTGLGKKELNKRWFWGLYLIFFGSVSFGFMNTWDGLISGVVGFEINDLLQDYIGAVGTVLVLLFFFAVYFIIRLEVTPEKIQAYFTKTKKSIDSQFKAVAEDNTDNITGENVNQITEPEPKEQTENTTKTEENSKQESAITKENVEDILSFKIETPKEEEVLPNLDSEPEMKMEVSKSEEEELAIEVEKPVLEEEASKNLSDQLVEDFGEFDPTLELGNYQFPKIDLLKDYSQNNSITIDQGELEENKNTIVETLKNYKIGISSIKATIGPTVTLYEIVPEAGIRISKIKNLEDDIALSLAALGIRIIAPIPGRGTIGIEVPNKKSSIVSMRSSIASTKFQNAEMELPISFGKNISNETLVVDLAKMPHLLMAGATGQGKSVGLNCILTSLLYKKHPAEVKFVLVDPKKVELTLFNKIERHFLAKLPDTAEAIITDNAKVINTLNSLCIEMDDRYELLKNAYVRNIKEYNTKFKKRQLNPENGHRFLPYIVLVIDEFADLIMTAGKEVETPIARLAQLARAIGIHLIIATQRPSVNVITGMIKANFPARVAFRVMSKIDSRTILDAGGADQLIGRGDMLYTNGNDLIRVQCAFVDTPEVERITDFIGSQKAYPTAHMLPEYEGEESGTTLDNNIEERDKLFSQAAEVIVTAQQGSTSLIQRKLKLGYNRAGRIIDQLEAAGIVGPFEGSKARQVLVPDLVALEKLLSSE